MMNGHTAFGWMLVKEDDYRELLKERQKLHDAHTEQQSVLQNACAERNDLSEILMTSRENYDRDIKSLTAAMVKAEADLKTATTALTIKTAECKQTRDDLLEARKLLWQIPDSLPRDIAEQVDWEKCGLPDPLEAGVPK